MRGRGVGVAELNILIPAATAHSNLTETSTGTKLKPV